MTPFSAEVVERVLCQPVLFSSEISPADVPSFCGEFPRALPDQINISTVDG